MLPITDYYRSAEEILEDFRSGKLQESYPLVARAIELATSDKPVDDKQITICKECSHAYLADHL